MGAINDLMKETKDDKHDKNKGKAYSKGPHAPASHTGTAHVEEIKRKQGKDYDLHGSGLPKTNFHRADIHSHLPARESAHEKSLKHQYEQNGHFDILQNKWAVRLENKEKYTIYTVRVPYQNPAGKEDLKKNVVKKPLHTSNHVSFREIPKAWVQQKV